MLPESEKLVLSLRERTSAATAELNEAEKRFGENNDQRLKDHIRQARHWLNDIENHFIRRLHDLPPERTPADEVRVLAEANVHLDTYALPAVGRIVEWSKTFGSRFKTIGL